MGDFHLLIMGFSLSVSLHLVILRHGTFYKRCHILCSVGVHTVSELNEMKERMESSQLKTYNLTENDLVKDHLRYLVI